MVEIIEWFFKNIFINILNEEKKPEDMKTFYFTKASTWGMLVHHFNKQ